MKSSGIGGQAVIEGIMMKNQDQYAVAVRKPNHEIEIKKETYAGIGSRYKICRLPFIRGVFGFVDSLVLGMSTLMFSASFFEEEEEEQKPSKIEQKLTDLFGEKLESMMMTLTVIVSIVLAVGLFMVLPAWLTGLLKPVIPWNFAITVMECVLRIAMFVGYVALISKMEDIKRTYMYHGAEHKCINCIEHGLDLTVENVAKSSREHKRCGTSFLLIVMMISIVFFLVIHPEGMLMRIVSRILLLPVIAGVSYEFLRLAGNSDSRIVNALSKPGLMLQRLTTQEPTEDMIEVAIQAVEAVFDWRAYERETFGKEFPETEDGRTEATSHANSIVR